MIQFSHISAHVTTCYDISMSYQQTTSNPPNPLQCHAGNKPSQTFFRNLAETLNAAHSNNGLHIYSQGFSHHGTNQTPSFAVPASDSKYDVIEIAAPVPSRAHTSIGFVVRARHAAVSSSTGTLKIKVYNGNSSASVIGTVDTSISSASTAQLLVHDLTISAPTSEYITIQVGLGATGSGISYMYDISASWRPLSSLATTKSEQGAIFPIGTGPTADDMPASAALGYCLATTAGTLQSRLKAYVSHSALNLSDTVATEEKYVHPFVRPHLVRVQDSRQSLRLHYSIKAINTGFSSKKFRIQAVDVRTLFESRSEANYFSSSGDRDEGVELTLPNLTTQTFTGYIDLSPPFQTLRNISDGHFVAFAAGSPAMAPRGPMRYNGGSSFDHDVKIVSYSFWGE